MNNTTSTTRKLRIASVYSNMIIGGDQNRLLEYLSSRNQNKYEHFVITGLRPTEEHEKFYGPIFDRFRSIGIEVIELGVMTRYTQWQSASRANRFLDQIRTFSQLVEKTTEILKQYNIDIVEGRCDMGTILATLAGRRAGVNAIISTNYFPQLERFRSPLWSIFGKYLHTKIDAVICDSVACLNDMRDWMIFPPPGYCIPNGIRPPQATIAKEKIALQLGIPTDAKVIAQIARVQPYKGQDLLLEAAPEILAKHPNAFFLICGYSGVKRSAQEYLVRLKAIAENTGIRDRVCITSYPGNIGDIWPLVYIHAHPTLRDSSPIALLEGMAMGLPAVTTRIGGIHELVINGESGIVLPPNDSSLMAQAVIKLLDNPQEVERLGHNAKQRYLANHTPELMAARTEDLFDQVSGSSG